jgi:hypothetical protein
LPEENIQKGDAVPLKRLKDEYPEQDGVRFLMEDEAGNAVACRVSHEALRNHADRMHISGTEATVFDRELIEEVASETHCPCHRPASRFPSRLDWPIRNSHR